LDSKRLKRYGKDTLFFRMNAFTFVVQNSTIVTIEISNQSQRHLNKISPVPLGKTKECESMVVSASANEESEVPLFKLKALAHDDAGRTLFGNLGSYESKCVNGSAELPREIPAFRHEVVKRFREKRPSWILHAVFASLGKKGESVTELEE
jgi:hypothetical protein